MDNFKILFDKETDNKFKDLYLNFVSINKVNNIVKATFVTNQESFKEYSKKENLDEIKQACNKIFEDVEIYEVIIRVPLADNDVIKKSAVVYLKKKYPLLSDNIDFTSVQVKKLSDNKIQILFKINKSAKNIVDSSDIYNKLSDYLTHEYAIEVDIDFIYEDIVNYDLTEKKKIEEAMYDTTIDMLKIEVREQMYKLVKSSYATKLKDLKEGTFSNVCIAGTLLSIKSFKSKKNKMIYNLDIQQDTNIFSISVFTDLDNEGPPFTNLIIKEKYAFEGRVSYNEFKKKNSMIANSFALVDIVNNVSDDYFTNIIKDEYNLVKPTKFDLPEMKAATSLEDFLLTPKKEECPEVLKGKTFVVFDLETTGLNIEGEDKITEIAAIKIVDGKKSELFETLINPEKTIPYEVSLKTGITNEMVQNMPKIGEVVADFFKFIEGSMLVGHNAIAFDIPFLNANVKNYKYKIKDDIPVYDTLKIARKTIQTPSREYRLEKLAEFLNVDLTNAHRAKYDTLATTEIFLYLAKNYGSDLIPS